MNEIETNLNQLITPQWFAEYDVNYVPVVEKLTEYANAVKEIYPNSDFQVANTLSFGFVPAFVIKFNDIEIENNDSSHKIKNLLVKFELKLKDNELIIDDIKGVRLTVDHLEYANNYSHSHLPTGTIGSYSDFCLGESSLRQSKMIFNANRNIPNFKLFLYNIEEYVKWESLDGGPYIKIKSLLPRKKVIGNIPIDYRYINTIIDTTLKIEHFDLQGGSNISVIDNDKFNNYLLSVLPDNYKTNVVNNLEYELDYVNYTTNSNKYCDIVFNKELIKKVDITDADINRNNDDKDIRIIKKVREYIIEKLNNKLKYIILYEYGY